MPCINNSSHKEIPDILQTQAPYENYILHLGECQEPVKSNNLYAKNVVNQIGKIIDSNT